jgi:2-keto-3-deoxy-L-rhamnonate aldolase RhmA
MNRAAGWGAEIPERDPLCVIQIESAAAVAEADAIARLDGVDVLFVGPADLSRALGGPIEDAVDAVLAATEAAGKAAGILVRSREDLEARLARGFRFVAVGSDSLFLAEAARAAAGA